MIWRHPLVGMHIVRKVVIYSYAIWRTTTSSCSSPFPFGKGQHDSNTHIFKAHFPILDQWAQDATVLYTQQSMQNLNTTHSTWAICNPTSANHMETMRVVYYTSKTVEATSDLKAVTQEPTLLSQKSMTDCCCLFEKEFQNAAAFSSEEQHLQQLDVWGALSLCWHWAVRSQLDFSKYTKFLLFWIPLPKNKLNFLGWCFKVSLIFYLLCFIVHVVHITLMSMQRYCKVWR